METIPQERIEIVESVLDSIQIENVKKVSPCLYKLMLWVYGVIEFHRCVRVYSLNKFDGEILNKDEIEFCNLMDDIYLLYFKLLRFVSKYCKEYEEKAKEVMNSC